MSANEITDSIGCGLFIAVIFGTCIGLQQCGRSDDARRTSCRLRWSHAATYDDSLKTAKLCGTEGKK